MSCAVRKAPQTILPTSTPLHPPWGGCSHPCPPSFPLQSLHPQPDTFPRHPGEWGSLTPAKQVFPYLYFLPGVMDAGEPPGCQGAACPQGQGDTPWGPLQAGPALPQLPPRPGAFPADKRCSASLGRSAGRWRSSINTSLLNSLLVFIACAWHRVRCLRQTQLRIIFKEASRRAGFLAEDWDSPDLGLPELDGARAFVTLLSLRALLCCPVSPGTP